jgi:hypothetical protein
LPAPAVQPRHSPLVGLPVDVSQVGCVARVHCVLVVQAPQLPDVHTG